MFQEFSKYAIQSPLMHMYLPIALNLISRENGMPDISGFIF